SLRPVSERWQNRAYRRPYRRILLCGHPSSNHLYVQRKFHPIRWKNPGKVAALLSTGWGGVSDPHSAEWPDNEGKAVCQKEGSGRFVKFESLLVRAASCVRKFAATNRCFNRTCQT